MTFTLQWTRDGVPIPNAINATYTVTSADVGHTLFFQVTATGPGGVTVATSAGVPIAAAGTAPSNSTLPVISGDHHAGSTTSVSTGTWTGSSPITYTYQWQQDGANITGATGASLLLTSGMVGHAIRAVVTGHNSVGQSPATSTSFTVLAALAAPVNTVAPAVTGSTNVGDVGSCSTGTWTGTPTITYAYQWRKDGTNIAGQTSSAYTYVSGDVGHNITCVVTATNAVGNASATSNTVVPTSSGTIVDIPNQAALSAMFAAGVGVSGGKTYRLAANTDFGGLGCYGVNFLANPIVIFGQTGTVFQWMEFDAAKGILWRDFNVYGTGSSGYAVALNNANNESLNFLRVTTNSGTAEGTQSGNGWRCLGQTGHAITIQGHRDASVPDIAGRGNAINLSNSSMVTVKDLTITNFSVDGILVAGCDSCVIDGNLIHDANYGAGDHPDGLQFFSSGATPTSNCSFTNNGLMQLPGELQMQGIFGEDAVNLTVQNNWIYGGTPTSIGNARGNTALINNNFCQGINDGHGGSLGTGGNVVTRGAAVNTTVSNTTAYAITNYAGDGVNPGYVPNPLPGSNTVTGVAVTWGDYTALDVWLAANPTARRRP